MPQANDLSRCLTALDQDSTLIAVIEMSQSSWLVAAIVPGIERHPAKKLDPDPAALLGLLQRWQAEAQRSGRQISRIALLSVWFAPLVSCMPRPPQHPRGHPRDAPDRRPPAGRKPGGP